MRPFVVAVLLMLLMPYGQASAQVVLCEPVGLSGPDYYLYSTPSSPRASDSISLMGGREDYFQPIGSVEVSGNTLNLKVEAYYRGIAGPGECAVVNLGFLAPGTYTLNLYFKNRNTAAPFELVRTRALLITPSIEPVPATSASGLAVLILLVVCSVIWLSVRPAAPP